MVGGYKSIFGGGRQGHLQFGHGRFLFGEKQPSTTYGNVIA
ncbi:hypothetical protein FB004_107236 [Sinorhizobium medicae]|nr:hypothetical protein FB004_107236 [Sinorhizobium medicae]TWA29282.1 hypothetical protein FB006_102237 [Sinorhizobium medicae]TWA37640.1 hypothetical protein FB007_104149 [Sinorhizobium medicae]TWA39614.1 hypothetical protein FB009_106238 [Sinorhizobium medicae]TWA47068.1 hypothetical protein FB005_103214 [Sinorhizobium medicae]